jgi:hypothetical protein
MGSNEKEGFWRFFRPEAPSDQKSAPARIQAVPAPGQALPSPAAQKKSPENLARCARSKTPSPSPLPTTSPVKGKWIFAQLEFDFNELSQER